MKHGFKPVIIMLSLMAGNQGFTQETTRILLERADTWEYNKAIGPDIQRILGNVILSHDSATLYCDSAYLNEKLNEVTAYGNIHVMINDTLNIFGDSLRYNGNTRIARLQGNAKLVDNQTILTSDTLIYDRNTDIAEYGYWGKIVNGDNVLVSHYGYYHTGMKEFFFKEKVFLRNPDFTMHSDTLKYNTVTEIAYFFGPSNIVGGEDSIYTENGWYNTTTDEARFRKNARVFHEEQVMTGDSMYYDRTRGYGEIFQNALLVDTAEHIFLAGNYGEVIREKGYAYMTQRALAGMIEDKDTLFMHSDTIKGYFDSAQNIELVKAYYKAKFYRYDLQGMGDSLVYQGKDSTLYLYHGPVLWSEENQLTADTITLVTRNGRLDSLVLRNNAFIISKDDTTQFNQIKGRDMVGYFRDNDLYKVKVLGNSETIYFAREEDKTLIGVNKVVSSDMLIFLDNRKFKSITYIGRPTGGMYPIKDLTPYDLRLRDFQWLDDKRPRSKEDIFLP